MSHCHDEHDDHHHNHNHGEHDHTDDITPALQSSLYKHIEFEKITTLNEARPRSGAGIVKKTWQQRLDAEPSLASDADEQILMTIPFAGSVKLHSLLLRSSTNDTAPRTVKLFQNRDDLTFSNVSDAKPTQVLVLSQTSDVQDVPVKRSLFTGTYSLTLFFEDNHSQGAEDVTEFSYLAFKGDFTKLIREPVEVAYEKAANPKDHTLIQGLSESASHHLGQ